MIRALVLSLMLFSGWAQAGVTAEEVDEIRAVINRQIDAFKRDDARSAFALVSPGVQEAFGTPERFLDTVRVSYRAVYRPAQVAFLGLHVCSSVLTRVSSAASVCHQRSASRSAPRAPSSSSAEMVSVSSAARTTCASGTCRAHVERAQRSARS